MDSIELSEAEIQLLAALHASLSKNRPTDRASLERSGECYAEYLDNWSQAFTALLAKGLIAGDDATYRLTDKGEPLARGFYAERPDRYYYYYRDFYRRAYASEAHSKLCEHAFGLDLTQEGQMDMDGVEDLIARLDLGPGQHLLDLGCGAGGIAEYIAGRTGARVTGVDFSAAAVEVGSERTADRREQIDFVRADLNHLDLPQRAYDAAVMIDSVYWIADTAGGIAQILKCLKPGGSLIILIAHLLEYCDDPAEFEIDKNFVATALDGLRLDYSAHDLTAAFLPFWPRVKQALDELRDDFFAEGNEFIYRSLFTEATTEFLPAIEAGQLRRYLYHVTA